MFFFEEPVFESTDPYLKSEICPQTGVIVNTPVLPLGLDGARTAAIQQRLIFELFQRAEIREYVLWYYTPMARTFASALTPVAIVYDCMDELSAFRGAPAQMRDQETALFREADLVFTGGASLFESKKMQHHGVYCFPSSIDFAHFAAARRILREPSDQECIPRPRIGYAGVIDERMDLSLIREISEEKPDWQLVLIGPVVKIDLASLPQAPNIHYLGLRAYSDLPAYFSGWQIGMLPFAQNESTRFISPTKTPEYLAAGLKVISTPIRDVVNPYGELRLVSIAESTRKFISVADSLLQSPPSSDFQQKVDCYLSQFSWDRTWRDMDQLITTVVVEERAIRPSLPSNKCAAGLIEQGAAHV